jgi:hypothetical protein
MQALYFFRFGFSAVAAATRKAPICDTSKCCLRGFLGFGLDTLRVLIGVVYCLRSKATAMRSSTASIRSLCFS